MLKETAAARRKNLANALPLVSPNFSDSLHLSLSLSLEKSGMSARGHRIRCERYANDIWLRHLRKGGFNIIRDGERGK